MSDLFHGPLQIQQASKLGLSSPVGVLWMENPKTEQNQKAPFPSCLSGRCFPDTMCGATATLVRAGDGHFGMGTNSLGKPPTAAADGEEVWFTGLKKAQKLGRNTCQVRVCGTFWSDASPDCCTTATQHLGCSTMRYPTQHGHHHQNLCYRCRQS